MSKMVKLCIMHACVVVVLVGAVMIANKMVVTPLRKQFQEVHTYNAEIEAKLEEVREKLDDVKTEVVKDLKLDNTELLTEYITKNTDNLTRPMIKNAAKALVDAAWENKIPLDLIVGIAQATTGFNTTYSTTYGRGILSVSNHHVKTTGRPVRHINRVSVGANVGATYLSELCAANKNNTLKVIIDKYLHQEEAAKVFEFAAEFSKFGYNAYREHIRNLSVQIDTEE